MTYPALIMHNSWQYARSVSHATRSPGRPKTKPAIGIAQQDGIHRVF